MRKYITLLKIKNQQKWGKEGRKVFLVNRKGKFYFVKLICKIFFKKPYAVACVTRLVPYGITGSLLIFSPLRCEMNLSYHRE